MSSDRNRFLAIFGAVAVVLGGAAYYYVRIYSPNEARGVAREEFKDWDEHWKSVRFCLLGEERSSNTAQALAIHEMIDQSWQPKSCTNSVGKLGRGPGESSGISAIEDAWASLDRASSKLADAFSKHVQMGSSWHADGLPDAFDNAVAARLHLRDALGLDDDHETTLGTLPLAEVVPMPGVTKVRSDPYLSTAGGSIYFGTVDGKEAQITLRGGKPAAFARVDRTTHAVPDAQFGAAIEDGKLIVGAVIETGSIAEPVATLALPPLGKDEQPYAIAGVSSIGDKGLVVLGNEARLVVARADAAGAWKLEPPIAIERAIAEVDLDGRVAGMWSDPKHGSHARIWKAGEPDQDLAVKGQPEAVGAVCLTHDRTWFDGPETIYGLSRVAPYSSMTGGNVLLGCTVDAAILSASSGGYQICTNECREAMVGDAQHLMAVTDIGGKLIGITSHAGVIGVWREGAKEPTLYGLTDPVEMAMGRESPPMALTDGKVLDALATNSKGYVTIRVPVTK